MDGLIENFAYKLDNDQTNWKGIGILNDNTYFFISRRIPCSVNKSYVSHHLHLFITNNSAKSEFVSTFGLMYKNITFFSSICYFLMNGYLYKFKPSNKHIGRSRNKFKLKLIHRMWAMVRKNNEERVNLNGNRKV